MKLKNIYLIIISLVIFILGCEEENPGTKGKLSIITTDSITNITNTTAICGGFVIDDGGLPVIDRGVCWNKNQNPTISDEYTSNGAGTGFFESSLKELDVNTTYYVRAYAINSLGTAYGNENNFSTTGMSVSDYDGNIYEIRTIGSQTWMAENLKTTHYANGTEITLVESNASWDSLEITDKAMCYYHNSLTNGETYGALYTWAAAMNGTTSSSANPSRVQGACPDGWHMPSDDELIILEIYLGMNPNEATALGIRGTNEGSKLAGSGLWLKGSLKYDDTFGTSGFQALPAGKREDGMSTELQNSASFWSATESDTSRVFYRYINYKYTDVGRGNSLKYNGLSVRCIMD